MSEQQRQYRDMAKTASWTMVSRVLGLLRDQLMTATFGAGMVSSAFLLAFQIPNLFRRLLGEGALTAALVPALAAKIAREGRPAAFAFLNHVLRRVVPWMLGLTLLGIGISVGLALTLENTQRSLAAELTAWCLPYMPLICAAALFTSAVQLCGRFGLAEIAAGVLNLCLIATLAWLGPAWSDNLADQARALCVATVVGGSLQLLIPVLGLRREGWRADRSEPDAAAWDSLRSAFVPAVIGAGVLQINLLVSRAMAFGIDDKSLTHYHVANRVTELPVGLFSVSVAAVIFPALATAWAEGDKAALSRNYARGARLVMAINIGAAVALAALSKPILELLFQYGRFGIDDVRESATLLVLFSASMPFYALSALASRALNVAGRTDATLVAAVHALAVNAALSFGLTWLAWPGLRGASGLAVANLIAAAWQYAVLRRRLRRSAPDFVAEPLLRPFLQVIFGSLVLGAIAYQLHAWLQLHLWGMLPAKPLLFLTLLAGVVVGGGVYAWMLDQFGYPERDLIRGYLDRASRALWLRRGR